jgi:hypothetical protein
MVRIDRSTLVLLSIGLLVVSAIIVSSNDAESGIPPTPAIQNIYVDGTWVNATVYDDYINVTGTYLTVSASSRTIDFEATEIKSVRLTDIQSLVWTNHQWVTAFGGIPVHMACQFENLLSDQKALNVRNVNRFGFDVLQWNQNGVNATIHCIGVRANEAD